MGISIEGKLPVPIVVNGQPMQEVTMSALTMEESLSAISKAKQGQYVQVNELASMLTWTHGAEGATQVTYEQLITSANQNRVYLIGLREALEEKERMAAQTAQVA